jgi:HSP20 family protein
MTLVPYKGFSLFDDIDRNIARFLPRNLGEFVANAEGAEVMRNWTPAVDIIEEQDRYVVKADIPGVDPKDIEITIDNGVLTVKGERHSEKSSDKDGYKRYERTSGTFQRQFTLPDSVDVDGIKASGNHGVLEVVLPKEERQKPKKVTVS